MGTIVRLLGHFPRRRHVAIGNHYSGAGLSEGSSGHSGVSMEHLTDSLP
jgi:hypothetical protein